MTHELREAQEAVEKASAHVHCGACGAELPRISTKAQQRPDSPQMKARIKHVTEDCPVRLAVKSETDGK